MKKWTLFVSIMTFLVILPHFLILCAYLEHQWIGSSTIGMLIFLPISYYFLPPALLFGKPHFLVEIGAGPVNGVGWMLAIGFYMGVSVILTMLLSKFICKKGNE